jgi:hypothetical protein
MIALLVMTDGRDHIFQTIPSFEAFASGNISERWIHDDSGDPHHAEKLRRVFPGYRVIQTAGRSGFGGAIRSAWSMLRAGSSAPFVFHLEDDFTFARLVDLGAMAALLDRHPELAQVALRRQPWNRDELAAGGIVEQHPGDYTDERDELLDLDYLTHRRFFTTNPSLYRRQLIEEHDWPEGPESEGRFSADLFADPAARSAFLGARSSGEWVHHIGTTRAGTGY